MKKTALALLVLIVAIIGVYAYEEHYGTVICTYEGIGEIVACTDPDDPGYYTRFLNPTEAENYYVPPMDKISDMPDMIFVVGENTETLSGR